MDTRRGMGQHVVRLQRALRRGRKIQGDDRRGTKRNNEHTKRSFRARINFSRPRGFSACVCHPNRIFTINERNPFTVSPFVLERAWTEQVCTVRSNILSHLDV